MKMWLATTLSMSFDRRRADVGLRGECDLPCLCSQTLRLLGEQGRDLNTEYQFTICGPKSDQGFGTS